MNIEVNIEEFTPLENQFLKNLAKGDKEMWVSWNKLTEGVMLANYKTGPFWDKVAELELFQKRWELKTEMIQLSNAGEKEKFEAHVLKMIEDGNMDAQGWDMFAHLININITEMQSNIEFWLKIFQTLKDIDCNDFGFRAGMRIAMIQTICEDYLAIADKNTATFPINEKPFLNP